jgi:hypothetical protein
VLAGSVSRDAHHGQQDGAGVSLVHTRIFEHFVEMHVKQPGGVLCPFDITAHPEKRLATRLSIGLLTAAVLVGTAVGLGAAYRLRGDADAPSASASRPGEEVSTQVSLEPPPWLELTIRLPLPQRHPGQSAGQHPDLRAVVDRERPQVDVPGQQLIAELRWRS